MSISVGDLIRVDVTLQDTRWLGNKFRNVLHFNTHLGEIPDESVPDLLQSFATDWMHPVIGQLSATTFIQHIRFTNLTKPNAPIEEKPFQANVLFGGNLPNDDDVPQACCCFTKRSFSRGRASVGHFFFGPLPSIFCEAGRVKVDPDGFGDLNDTIAALKADFVSGTITWKPVVVAATATTAPGAKYVRTVTAAEYVTYLRTRRLGKGE